MAVHSVRTKTQPDAHEYRFVRSRADGEHETAARAALASGIECAACGESRPQHPYVVTTTGPRSYIYALCDECHRSMAKSKTLYGPRFSAAGPVAAAVDEALDRFVVAEAFER